ncbi:hypothetical protein LPB41_23620 [Thalassospira sp. MA62]|nr:hypothetical protein [Thalassospira sp. MA62]
MDWVPIAFGTFKVVAFGTAMFFAIKWHYDQGEKRDTRTLLRVAAKVLVIFALVLLCLGGLIFFLSNMLGLSLNY